MIKKFIALSLAVLVMASHMASAYAYVLPVGITIHDDTDQWTENGVTGKLYSYQNNPYHQTFHASTSVNKRYGYIFLQIFLENAVNNANIDTSTAAATNWDNIDAHVNVTYGHAEYARVTSIHKAGSSENNLAAAFGLRKIYKL